MYIGKQTPRDHRNRKYLVAYNTHINNRNEEWDITPLHKRKTYNYYTLAENQYMCEHGCIHEYPKKKQHGSLEELLPPKYDKNLLHQIKQASSTQDRFSQANFGNIFRRIDSGQSRGSFKRANSDQYSPRQGISRQNSPRHINSEQNSSEQVDSKYVNDSCESSSFEYYKPSSSIKIKSRYRNAKRYSFLDPNNKHENCKESCSKHLNNKREHNKIDREGSARCRSDSHKHSREDNSRHKNNQFEYGNYKNYSEDSFRHRNFRYEEIVHENQRKDRCKHRNGKYEEIVYKPKYLNNRQENSGHDVIRKEYNNTHDNYKKDDSRHTTNRHGSTAPENRRENSSSHINNKDLNNSPRSSNQYCNTHDRSTDETNKQKRYSVTPSKENSNHMQTKPFIAARTIQPKLSCPSPKYDKFKKGKVIIQLFIKLYPLIFFYVIENFENR